MCLRRELKLDIHDWECETTTTLFRPEEFKGHSEKNCQSLIPAHALNGKETQRLSLFLKKSPFSEDSMETYVNICKYLGFSLKLLTEAWRWTDKMDQLKNILSSKKGKSLPHLKFYPSTLKKRMYWHGRIPSDVYSILINSAYFVVDNVKDFEVSDEEFGPKSQAFCYTTLEKLETIVNKVLSKIPPSQKEQNITNVEVNSSIVNNEKPNHNSLLNHVFDKIKKQINISLKDVKHIGRSNQEEEKRQVESETNSKTEMLDEDIDPNVDIFMRQKQHDDYFCLTGKSCATDRLA